MLHSKAHGPLSRNQYVFIMRLWPVQKELEISKQMIMELPTLAPGHYVFFQDFLEEKHCYFSTSTSTKWWMILSVSDSKYANCSLFFLLLLSRANGYSSFYCHTTAAWTNFVFEKILEQNIHFLFVSWWPPFAIFGLNLDCMSSLLLLISDLWSMCLISLSAFFLLNSSCTAASGQSKQRDFF